MHRSLWIVLAVALAACLPLAAESNPIGEWSCTATTPNGERVPWTLLVQREEGKLAATIKSHRGELKAHNTRLEQDTLVFSVKVGEGEFEISLRIEGDQLKGNWKGTDASGAMVGSRTRKS